MKLSLLLCPAMSCRSARTIKDPQTLAGAGRGENRIPSGYAHQSGDVTESDANAAGNGAQNSAVPTVPQNPEPVNSLFF